MCESERKRWVIGLAVSGATRAFLGRGSHRALPLGTLALGLLACGPSYESNIKTPADRVREQEELAYKAELEKRQEKESGGTFVDPDAPGSFDQRQAELEMKRATLSAETCVDVVNEDDTPYGKTTVTVTFALDGSVAETAIPSPFADTRLGNCVLNAYRGIYLPPYTGEREVLSWEVNLEKPKGK